VVTIDIRGVEEIQAFLRTVPRGTIRVAIDAIADYLLGNERRGLKHSPPRVQHGPGNPYKWQSEKQRRAYFATDGFGGGILYRRTGKMAESWQKRATNDGYRMSLKNASSYAQYVQGDRQQTGHAADKWRKVAAIISTNMTGAMRAANQAVERWLKARNK